MPGLCSGPFCEQPVCSPSQGPTGPWKPVLLVEQRTYTRFQNLRQTAALPAVLECAFSRGLCTPAPLYSKGVFREKRAPRAPAGIGICSAADKWPQCIPDARFPGPEAAFSPRGFGGAKRGSPSQGGHSKLGDRQLEAGAPRGPPHRHGRPGQTRHSGRKRSCVSASRPATLHHSLPRSGPEPRLPLASGGFPLLSRSTGIYNRRASSIVSACRTQGASHINSVCQSL